MTAGRDQHSSLGISLLMPSQLAALATCIAEVWNHQILSTLVHWLQNRCHPGVSATLTLEILYSATVACHYMKQLDVTSILIVL